MHQGSALSPLLFVILMEALSRKFRVALPWELLYADDLVVIAETEDTHTTHTTVLRLCGICPKTRVSRYQKKHSP